MHTLWELRRPGAWAWQILHGNLYWVPRRVKSLLFPWALRMETRARF